MGLLIYKGIKNHPRVGDLVVTTKLRDPAGVLLFPIGSICKIIDVAYSIGWDATKYRLVRIDNEYKGWWYKEDMFEPY